MEKSGLHVTPSTPSTVQGGARDGLEHRSTMGRRSGGNATILASESWRAVPVDGCRRVVKYAWVRPIKRKTGAELLKAFESIVAEGRHPQTL